MTSFLLGLAGLATVLLVTGLIVGLIVFARKKRQKEDAGKTSVSNENKKSGSWFKWLVSIAAITVVLILLILKTGLLENKPQPQTSQIYPNYEFPEGVNQITIPLIPTNQLLSQEAGGWTITPDGSEWIVDHKVAVNVEFIDGRKVYCEPHKPIYVGVRPANRIFRIYGSERDTVLVSITRGVY